MKRLIFFFFVLTSLSVQAQPGRRGDRVIAAEMEYIINRLALTENQTRTFQPIYHRYTDERREQFRALTKSIRELRGRSGDSAALRRLELSFKRQEARTELQRRYQAEFIRVLSARQVEEVFRAERDFHQMVYQRLRKGRVKANTASD